MEYPRILRGIVLVPYNIVMNVNNVMNKNITKEYKNTTIT